MPLDSFTPTLTNAVVCENVAGLGDPCGGIRHRRTPEFGVCRGTTHPVVMVVTPVVLMNREKK
jgi:hypothetical protein